MKLEHATFPLFATCLFGTVSADRLECNAAQAALDDVETGNAVHVKEKKCKCPATEVFCAYGENCLNKKCEASLHLYEKKSVQPGNQVAPWDFIGTDDNGAETKTEVGCANPDHSVGLWAPLKLDDPAVYVPNTKTSGQSHKEWTPCLLKAKVLAGTFKVARSSTEVSKLSEMTFTIPALPVELEHSDEQNDKFNNYKIVIVLPLGFTGTAALADEVTGSGNARLEEAKSPEEEAPAAAKVLTFTGTLTPAEAGAVEYPTVLKVEGLINPASIATDAKYTILVSRQDSLFYIESEDTKAITAAKFDYAAKRFGASYSAACPADNYVKDNECKPCVDGLAKTAGDDPTGKNTSECKVAPGGSGVDEEGNPIGSGSNSGSSILAIVAFLVTVQ